MILLYIKILNLFSYFKKVSENTFGTILEIRNEKYNRIYEKEL